LWASRICTAALTVHGDDAELLFVTAKAFVSLGSPADAIPILRQLLARFPQVTKYRLELIRVLRLAGQEDASMQELTTAANMIASFPLHWKLINALLGDGQPDLARKMAEEAMQRWPERSAILDKVLRAA
jgi:tetratricopeptide (TPR) repeat protein